MTRAFHFAWQTSAVVPVAQLVARTRFSALRALTLVLLVPALLSCGTSSDIPAYAPAPFGGDAGPVGDTDSGTVNATTCDVPGTAGCPCTEAGATADCGRIDYISGDYVTCIIGTAQCDGTQWGACTGNRIVAQSIRGQALTTSGKRMLSTSGSCNTPCDPRCTKVVGQTKDVDAGGLNYTDAGISITGTTGNVGPGGGPCKGLWCQVAACNGLPKTSISGKVYDPAGKNPLYDAYVYIPVDPTIPLPAFTAGVSCDTCAGAGSVSAIAVAQTGPDGKFTLTNVPAGANVPLVVQMGKWRRKITLPNLTSCTDNPVTAAYSRLPRNRTDGDNNTADIPHIAIASGSADPFECLLLKAGIDATEIQAPGNNARIDYYVQNGIDRAPGAAPAGSTLTSSLTTLKKYDVVLLPCEGKENDAHLTDVPNLASFADLGGRVFTTHFGYSWLATPLTGVAQNKSEFYGTADWSKLNQSDYNDPMTAVIDQSFPKGLAYAQWLQNVSATTTQGSITINEPRHDARSAKNPPSQRWVYGSSKNATAGTSDMLLSMTFNTPTTATAANQCGRVVYSDFHVSADALVSGTSCATVNDCGFGATCNSVTPGTCSAVSCKANSGCSTGYSCSGAAQGSCSTQTCYAASECGTGRTCPGGKTGTCSLGCFATADCSNIWGSTCGGAVKGTCSALTCKTDAACGVGTCNGEVAGSCAPSPLGCWANTDCTAVNSKFACTGEVNGACSAATCKANADCGTGSTCTSPAAKLGSCLFPATSCWANSDCTSINGSATCGGAKSGACSALTCKATADCGAGSTCTSPAPKTGSCTFPATSCFKAADCTGVNGASCGGVVNGTCAAGTCKVSSDCGNGTCGGATQGTCKKNNGTTSSVRCWQDTDCTAGGLSSTYHCNSPVLGSCSLNSCTSTTDCGGRACNGAKAGSCSGASGSCINTADCSSLGSAYSCTGGVLGTCTNPVCNTNANCGASRTCVGSTAGSCSGPTAACYANPDCSSLGTGYTCNGGALGTCTNPVCTNNSSCSAGRTCQGQKIGACTGPTGSCWQASDCSSLGAGYACNNPVLGNCSSVSCTANGDCGGGSRTCQNAVPGACSNGWNGAKSCEVKSDCSSWGAAANCSGSTAGTCSAASCYAATDCGASGTCNGGKMGSCQDTCSSNADCNAGLSCVSGICQGCLGTSCPTGSTCNGYTAGSCSSSGTMFPLTCRNGDLSAQEKALEFMLFDLSACVSPDSWTPPVPGVSFGPVTFNLDYTAQCPASQRPIWREFDWQAQIPDTSDITFTVQTAATAAGLTTAKSVALGKSTSSTPLPGFDVAVIDTTSGGAFQKVDPPLMSLTYLRIAATLDPTTDNKASPTLIAWEVHYDCVDSQ